MVTINVDEKMVTHNFYPALWIGRNTDLCGYQTVTQTYLQAMLRANIPFSFLGSEASRQKSRYDDQPPLFNLSFPFTCIINERPDYYHHLAFQGNVFKVGCTLFETHSIPNAWLPALTAMDEVWVPTQFNLDTFSQAGVPSDKLRLMPYCLDIDEYRQHIFPLEIEGKRSFAFLYVVAAPVRKDIGLLLRSYYEAFTAKDDVCLILKVILGQYISMPEIASMVAPEYRFGDPALPAVIVLGEEYTREQMLALYKAVDVYATTERAKGWDLPAMEAAMLGKPSVSIDWSGSTEFLHKDNAFLIPHTGRLIPVPPEQVGNSPLYKNQKWMEVRKRDVIAALRRAYEENDLRRIFGKRAQQEVSSKYSTHAVGKLIAAALKDHQARMPRFGGGSVFRVSPSKTEGFDADSHKLFQGVAVENAFVHHYTLSKNRLTDALLQRQHQRVSVWGCSETGEAIIMLLAAAGIELVAVYDSNLTGMFAGKSIRHPADGFEPGIPVIIGSSRKWTELQPVIEKLVAAGVEYYLCD